MISTVTSLWKSDARTLLWLKDNFEFHSESESPKNGVRAVALQQLAENWSNVSDVLPTLKKCALSNEGVTVRCVAINELLKNWKDDPDTLPILKICALCDGESLKNPYFLRWVALWLLAMNWKDEPGMFEFLCDRAVNDPSEIPDVKISKPPNPRKVVLSAILKNYPDRPQTLELLHDRAQNDPDEQVREFAGQQLAELEEQLREDANLPH